MLPPPRNGTLAPPLPNFAPEAPQTWSHGAPLWDPQLPPARQSTAEISPDHMWHPDLPVEMHSQYLYSSGNHTPVTANAVPPPSMHASPTHAFPDRRSEPHFLNTHTPPPSHPLMWNDPALGMSQRASNDHLFPTLTRSHTVHSSHKAGTLIPTLATKYPSTPVLHFSSHAYRNTLSIV